MWGFFFQAGTDGRGFHRYSKFRFSIGIGLIHGYWTCLHYKGANVFSHYTVYETIISSFNY